MWGLGKENQILSKISAFRVIRYWVLFLFTVIILALPDKNTIKIYFTSTFLLHER